MNIPVSVTQVKDGLNYKGTIQIGEKNYTWTLSLGDHAKRILSCEARATGPEETANLFGIELKLEEKEIDISEAQTFVFLLHTVVRLTLDFYQESQTKEFNGPSFSYLCAGITGHWYEQMMGRTFPSMPTLSLSVGYDVPDELVPVQLI